MPRKVIVLGLDGLCWDILDPYIKEGKLPSFERLKDGYWGQLKSSLPFVTFPAWKCYSTGKNPGKLGVYWWMGVDFKRQRIYANNSSSFRAKEIWDYLGEAGLRVGVINMPSTYPPKEVRGFMISGMPAFEKYTYPAGLQQEIEAMGYAVDPKVAAEKDPDAYFEDVKRLVNVRFDLAEKKLDEVDFLQLTIFYTDISMHFLWGQNRLFELWELIDQRLGKLLETDTVVVVMSDHGMGTQKAELMINSWLEERGYLSLKGERLDALGKIGLNRDRAYRTLHKMKLLKTAKKIIPQSVRERIPQQGGTIPAGGLESRVDWKRSKALGLGGGCLYVNKEKVGDYEGFRERLIKELRDLRDPKSGERIFVGVHRREDVYTGPYVDTAPDIIIDHADGYEISPKIRVGQVFEFTDPKVSGKWKANHRHQGLYAFYGAGIRKGKADASIYDLMPSILSLYGLRAPEDVDGKVLNLKNKEEHKGDGR